MTGIGDTEAASGSSRQQQKKIHIRRIADPKTRAKTFIRRRSGLLRKAHELSVLCGMRIAIVMFDEKNMCHSYTSDRDQADSIIHSYLDKSYVTVDPRRNYEIETADGETAVAQNNERVAIVTHYRVLTASERASEAAQGGGGIVDDDADGAPGSEETDRLYVSTSQKFHTSSVSSAANTPNGLPSSAHTASSFTSGPPTSNGDHLLSKSIPSLEPQLDCCVPPMEQHHHLAKRKMSTPNMSSGWSNGLTGLGIAVHDLGIPPAYTRSQPPQVFEGEPMQRAHSHFAGMPIHRDVYVAGPASASRLHTPESDADGFEPWHGVPYTQGSGMSSPERKWPASPKRSPSKSHLRQAAALRAPYGSGGVAKDSARSPRRRGSMATLRKAASHSSLGGRHHQRDDPPPPLPDLDMLRQFSQQSNMQSPHQHATPQDFDVHEYIQPALVKQEQQEPQEPYMAPFDTATSEGLPTAKRAGGGRGHVRGLSLLDEITAALNDPVKAVEPEGGESLPLHSAHMQDSIAEEADSDDDEFEADYVRSNMDLSSSFALAPSV